MTRFIIGLGLIVILLYFSIATANRSSFDTIQSWQGLSANRLVARWGTPDIKIIRPNGNAVYIYNEQSYPNSTYRTQGSPSVGVNVSGGRAAIVVSPPPDYTTLNPATVLTCTVKFEVSKSGNIIETDMSGSGCEVGNWALSP